WFLPGQHRRALHNRTGKSSSPEGGCGRQRMVQVSRAPGFEFFQGFFSAFQHKCRKNFLKG
ncbi:MAG: hypothetical protein J6V48_08885, partial [Clostridia bacterium]|nr:hypothetical protein [Clostridia bacterium]